MFLGQRLRYSLSTWTWPSSLELFCYGRGLHLAHPLETSLSGHQQTPELLDGKSPWWVLDGESTSPPSPYQPIRIRNKTLSLSPHPLLPGAGEHGGSEDPSPRALAVPCRVEDYHKFPETPWQSRPCLHNHLVPTTRSPTEHGWLLRNFHLQINPRAITRPCKQAAGPHSGGAWGSMRMHGGPLLG